MSKKTPSWFRKDILGFYDVIPSVDWGTPGLTENALKDGTNVHTMSVSGRIDDGAFQSILEKLVSAAEMSIVTNDYVWDREQDPAVELGRAWAVGDHGSLVVSYTKHEKELAVNVQSTNKAHLEAVSEICKTSIKEEEHTEYVHALVQKSGRLCFQRVGKPHQALERTNYSSAVLKGYDRVVAEFNAQTPRGRIAIFDGPPGTGKSFCLRALLHDIKGVHVLIPAHLVSSLADPSILPLLIDLKKTNEDPIIFYVEDGDEVVAPRGADNMPAISSILNLGDGILGQCLDIRIIVTTNASRSELDQAITRPGRLVGIVRVGSLTPEEATTVYQRLTNTEEEITKPMTLAEVYSKALDAGFEPVNRKSKMGFGS